MPSVLSDDDAGKIRLMFEWYQRQTARPDRRGQIVPPATYLAYVAGTAITAAAGSTLGSAAGSGTVTLVALDSSGDMVARTGSGGNVTETVYNFTDTASGTNAFIYVTQDVDGTFWYHSEAC